VHIHFHGLPAAEQAAIIRQALPSEQPQVDNREDSVRSRGHCYNPRTEGDEWSVSDEA